MFYNFKWKKKNESKTILWYNMTIPLKIISVQKGQHQKLMNQLQQRLPLLCQLHMEELRIKAYGESFFIRDDYFCFFLDVSSKVLPYNSKINYGCWYLIICILDIFGSALDKANLVHNAVFFYLEYILELKPLDEKNLSHYGPPLRPVQFSLLFISFFL